MVIVPADQRPRSASERAGPILVIEDEPDLLTSYERLLRRLHYEVITADRGTEGLRIARSQRIRLVVTDLRLPDMDGIALIRALRAVADPPPIIVASALDSRATRSAALAAGAIAYLTKPFSVSTLKTLIQDIVEPVDGTAP
jgi:DNA-binding response OmpR family regulator